MFLREQSGLPHYLIYTFVNYMSSVAKHSLVVGYADDHSLLKIIPDKNSRILAASHLNSDLAALCHFGQHWLISFAPQKSSIISLKPELATSSFIFE